jgi:hypothetical protein
MPTSAPHLSIAPNLAQRFGLEQAAMLAVVTELVGAYKGQVIVEEQRLYSRASFLSRPQQAQLLSKLSSAGVVQVAPAGQGMVRISLTLDEVNATKFDHAHASVEPAADVKPAPAAHAPKNSLAGFGGWRREEGDGDELSRLFAQKEAHHQHLCKMDIDWQLSSNLVKILAQQHQISEAFALGIKDEFVVYYMDKGRKETPGGWDQKFLKWVKREQVHQQTAQARAQRQTQQQTNSSNEEAKYAAKQRRRNITENVLDINNTDW